MNISTANTLNTTYKNSSITFWLLLVILSVYSPLNNAATLKANNGFEDGSFGDMLPHGGGVETIVKSPVATGSYSSSFDLINGYPASKEQYRAEAWFSGSKGNFAFEKEYWLSFNYRYEDWAKDSNPEIGPVQIHTRPSQWTTSCQFNNAVGSAPFLMLSQDDEVRFFTYPGKVSWKAPIQKQKWQTITVHFRISTGSTGFIEAWKDGVKLFHVDGANSPKYDNCGGLMGEPFFNMGIYKWDWKRKVTDSKRRHLLIDNLKIAEGTDGYSMVTTAITNTDIVKDTTPPSVSNVQAAVTETTATITWNTNEASDSLAKYGATASYGSTSNNSLAVTTHSVTLNNLTAGSLYHYQVSSKDSSGNTGSSTDLTFTTDKATNESLVAYWPMDPVSGSTIPDMSGNGHNGKLINGALMTTSGGVKFDGVNDYLNVGKFDVPGNAISISAWVWSDNLSNCSSRDCRIISKATSTNEQDHYFMVSPVSVGSATRLRFRLKINGVTSTLIAATGNLSNKTWFHVAAVYDGTTMRLYKDGVEVGSMAKSGIMTTNSNAYVWIGGNPPSASSRPWKGQIDDVSIYNYALTKGEIAELAK